MRVVILSNSSSGLFNFRRELIEELCKRYEVTFCVPESNDYTEKLIGLGCECVITKFNRRGMNPIKDIRLLKQYRNIIRKVKPDIVLTYTIKPNIYGGIACQITKIPYIANITGLGTAVENKGLLQKVTIPMYRIGLKNARKVFFQNVANRNFMISHNMVKEKQYDVLPGSGVNLTKFTMLPYPQGNTVDFVFIGRIIKEKGIEQYLDAAREIRVRHPNTRFHICGTCEEAYETILKKLRDEGIVIYHGRVDDIKEIHRHCMCTIHPSYYPEGMSNTLLEACACGRPIITTDRPGCGEVVEDGVNGFVVRQRDSCDLIKQIEKFLSLSIEQKLHMGREGRKKMEREFNRQIVVDAYMVEIQNVIG